MADDEPTEMPSVAKRLPDDWASVAVVVPTYGVVSSGTSKINPAIQLEALVVPWRLRVGGRR